MDAEPVRAVESGVERMGGPPAQQLARLLARAENGAQAARGLDGTRNALMHYCGLQSCRHIKGPPRPMDRRTFRHSFLLPDGEVRLVWELVHTSGPGGETRCEVFTDREDLAVAEWEVDAAFGRASPPPGGPTPLDAPVLPDDLERMTGMDAPAGLEDTVDVTGGPPPADVLPEPLSWWDGRHRVYTEGRSADHARRLLRRASNANSPGGDVRRRLHGAVAHTIGIVTRRSTVVAGRPVSWSLYEHAFLLRDGSEVSLWEIDHTRTPNGSPVCEVYTSRDAALDMAIRRIEAG